MQRVANLVEAVRLGDLEVARGLVEGVLLEEEPDLVPRVQEVVVLCLKNIVAKLVTIKPVFLLWSVNGF